MDILYSDPGGVGYYPLRHMVGLATALFEANLLIFPNGQAPGPGGKMAGLLPSMRRGSECCLVICASPPRMEALLLAPGWRRKYRQVIAWVFDSFWIDHIPRIARGWSKHFDHIFVTEPEDIAQWKNITGIGTSWLPWGTDALRLGSANGSRPIDLLRVGRQPAAWEDDRKTKQCAEKYNLRFHGRPSTHQDARENQRQLMHVFARAKYSLSWSNKVSPAVQTHPNREYITARWTDALACGTTVAGIAPRTEAVQELLWPDALLQVGGVDLEQGMAEIAEAAATWQPESAIRNARNALERLDWRWRFKVVAEKFGCMPCQLEVELSELAATLHNNGQHQQER